MQNEKHEKMHRHYSYIDRFSRKICLSFYRKGQNTLNILEIFSFRCLDIDFYILILKCGFYFRLKETCTT